VDAGSSNLNTVVSVSHGTLTLGSTANLTYTGNGTNLVSFTGSLLAINSALNGMVYHPTADYNGSDTLQVTTYDLGNTGSGGTKSDSDSISITLNAVNDAPVNNLATSSLTINE